MSEPAASAVHGDALTWHWQELPQVSSLSRQKYACRDKTFVATSLVMLTLVAANTCSS